ncbi:hypothetical protein [Acinetobacter variabilis]|uniref:hypothetical protein n=1 Tax=Acinetobacter variabilis TaxID=70346 RepID=UPI0028ACE333|nr:hypothetical protein [Acinetobacter variabilis]
MQDTGHKWLLMLLMSVAVVMMQAVIKSVPEFGVKIPDVVVYAIAGFGLVYAGFLNMLSGTVIAKLFRSLVVAGVGIGLVYFIVEKF